MATNIGNLSFGIDADTKGLRKVIGRLNEFKVIIDRTAKAQTEGSKKATAAMVKQESALKRAISATLRLQQAQRKAGSAKTEIAATDAAIKKLTTALTGGALKTKEFTRAQDEFAVKMNTSRRAVTELNKAGDKGKGVSKFARDLRNLESASVLAVGPLSGLGARIRSLGAIASRSNLRIVGLFAGFTAGIVALFKLSAAAVNAGKVFESSMARFEAASGSIEIARKQMSFVIKTAQTLGLRIDTSAKAFSRLSAAAKGTSLEGEGARRVFLAVSKAAAALRLGAGEVEGTFRAIEQMMSKGSVQAEELRGQLGERLPGAFRLAAEAMGVTTMKLGDMLKAGEVLAEDFLPKLADALERAFGDKALDNVNSFQGSMNILANEGLLFAQAFNKVAKVSVVFIGAIQKLSGAIRFMREQLNNIIALLGAVAAGFIVLAGPAILGGLLKVGAAIRGMTIAMLSFNIVLAANPLVALASVSLRVAAAIGVTVAAFFGIKFALDATTEAIDGTDDALDSLEDHAKGMSALGSAFKTLSSDIDEAIAETKVLTEVLGFMDRFAIDDIDRLILKFTILGKVQSMTNDVLEATAKKLNVAFGDDTKQTIEAVADALFNVLGIVVELQTDLDNLKINDDAIRGGVEQLAELQLRLQALQEGQTAVDFFDDVESAVQAFNATFADTNLLLKDRRALEAAFRATLIATTEAEKDLDEAEKARKKTLRDVASAQKRFDNQLIKSAQQIDIMRERVKALAKGPDSFEVFTKVTQKVMKFRNALMKVTDNQFLINELTRQYTSLLEEELKLTDRFARASQQMASAVRKSLEDIIVAGGSVKSMLHDLANELLRVALRALFLDNLQQGLSSFFGGFLNQPAAATTGGGGTTGPIQVARGISFRVPGSGGSDHVPVNLMAKPGEIVSVRRPDQITGGGGLGGGGGGVTIIQNNTFERTIADSATLIPLLEENNRKIKGELLDGFDRGTFG